MFVSLSMSIYHTSIKNATINMVIKEKLISMILAKLVEKNKTKVNSKVTIKVILLRLLHLKIKSRI